MEILHLAAPSRLVPVTSTLDLTVTASATLVVEGWDRSRAWFPGTESYVKNMLLKHLQLSSPMPRTEAKRMVKQLLARELLSVALVDGQYAHAMRHWLESLGAQVQIVAGEATL